MPCADESHGLRLLAYLRSSARDLVPMGQDFLCCSVCGETLYDEHERENGTKSPFVDDLKRARGVLIDAAARTETIAATRSKRERARLCEELARRLGTEALKLDDTLSVYGHGAVLPAAGLLS